MTKLRKLKIRSISIKNGVWKKRVIRGKEDNGTRGERRGSN